MLYEVITFREFHADQARAPYLGLRIAESRRPSTFMPATRRRQDAATPAISNPNRKTIVSQERKDIV